MTPNNWQNARTMKMSTKLSPGASLRAPLIGVMCKDSEESIAREFFELFKTPWEFFQKERPYSVILSTDGQCPKTDARLIIVYSSENLSFDQENCITAGPLLYASRLECGDVILPTCGCVGTFKSTQTPVLKVKESSQAAGIIIQKGSRTILRIGYNLFGELQHLLTRGQSAPNAGMPTLEIHISMLRRWILEAGIPIVEIPPVPAGYDFVCCLTHDVDFAGIRRHRLDRTVMGFLLRATLICLADVLRGRQSKRRLFANLKAVLELPAVYLGLKKDYWIQFDQYMNIEKDMASTFFFIPYKNRPGRSQNGKVKSSRATKYDIRDVEYYVKKLIDMGCEIGLHGIDAWCDSERGRDEAARITSVTGKACHGVRMHWLYFDRDTPRILDKAGFTYDSTMGFNEAVGYRGGTSQVFRPPGALDLLELPLHIQDSALFFRRRMGLSEMGAFGLCQKLVENFPVYKGVLTINWHDRSLGPERLWGDFYRSLLSEIRKNKVWFATGREVVQWFHKRRMVTFQIAEDTRSADGTCTMEMQTAEEDGTPAFRLRIYSPLGKVQSDLKEDIHKREFIDLQFPNDPDSDGTEEAILEDEHYVRRI